jgi:60 kDa SS-A/Ro ribonucleoprotein
MKRVVAKWYASRGTDKLAYQMIKYRSRSGFDHKRAIEVAHNGAGEDAARQALYLWARGKDVERETLPTLVQAHLKAMKADNRDDLMKLVAEHNLPWEAIPTEALNDPGVWQAMLPYMGLTALIRNLGNMTACEAIKPMDCAEVVKRLGSEEDLRKSRVHPFTILQALAVYRSGYGVRGGKSWSPVTQVVDALDKAFYAAFKNVEPTGKNILLALDVSGSMTSSMGGSPLSCREASAALALVTLATEANTQVVGFTGGGGWGSRYNSDLTPLNLSARQRLDDAVREVSNLPFGGTDCALPMLYATRKGMPVDAFIIYTDNETWAGNIHPVQALQEYRKTMNRNAKCIVVGMTSTGFSIADPGDGGMLDMVGFDGSCPALISNFIKQ